MIFIGDIHGKGELYWPLIKKADDANERTIQIGDMGCIQQHIIPSIDERNKFIRGNHDDPAECKTLPGYLGDFGYLEKDNIFYFSGAWSIDRNSRLMGYDLFEDEELSMAQCMKALDLYIKSKPFIVVSHDCPQIAKAYLMTNVFKRPDLATLYPTRTNQILQQFFEIHKPSYWIFGHYHRSTTFKINKTRFVCIGEGETYQLELS